MTTAQQPDPFGATRPALPGLLGGPRAGFWLRAAASLLDTLVLIVPYIVFLIAVGADAADTLLLLTAAAYFAVLEGGPSGQSLGKKACGIRVVDLSLGGPIGPGRALIRWICRWISLVALGLGYLWMLWDPEKQTWHDKLANAVVVPVRAYPIG
jgi:uncharacterized RDD family membrane protein YckC